MVLMGVTRIADVDGRFLYPMRGSVDQRNPDERCG